VIKEARCWSPSLFEQCSVFVRAHVKHLNNNDTKFSEKTEIWPFNTAKQPLDQEKRHAAYHVFQPHVLVVADREGFI
jgi:hypothetical protein